jgi:hypothetical protein
MLLSNSELAVPVYSQSVAIIGDDGSSYFTGAIATMPSVKYAGMGMEGPRYRYFISALGDDVTLNTLSVSPAQVHLLDENGGNLNPANLEFEPNLKRALANDVTVCGEKEPVAYVTEYFLGDGVTPDFYLATEPFFSSATRAVMIQDSFDGVEIDNRIWSNSGNCGYFALGSGGFAMLGGSGFDGQTVLSSRESVEMAGTLLLEITGLVLASGSAGIVAGFFDGGTDSSSCIAGFKASAQQGTGSMTLQPMAEGGLVGATISLSSTDRYTLRLRIHSPEGYRETATYRSLTDSGMLSAGGTCLQSPGRLQFEVQPFVNGVGGMPVTLYEGTVTSLPAICNVVAASSVNLVGSIRSLRLTNLGSGWVVSAPSGGGARIRRIGSPIEGGECQLDRNGRLEFEAGYIPAVGEQIAVSYRTTGRAVGRVVNSANQEQRTRQGLPAIAAWMGTVTQPAARCSADCRNAAEVTAQSAAMESGSLRGKYIGTSLELAADVRPADALQLKLPSISMNSQVIVREVDVSFRTSLPEVLKYEIAFANDWAEDLAIQRSEVIPKDVWPTVAIKPTVLPSLNGLTVTTMNGFSVSINTGAAPPDGGGFEIRRRDFDFKAGTDAGLVTRSTQPNITFARESANDRFYVRMYDNASPPNYSEFSTALFINAPLGS